MKNFFDQSIFLNFDKLLNEVNDSLVLTKVTQNDENYRIRIAVPGLSKSDIKIKISDKTLSISYDEDKDNVNPFIGSFNKSYKIPHGTDEDLISAKVENGIVEVTLPKEKKKSSERIVTVN